ncbi:MAG: ABC transporter ATP-binding protein [Desulfobacteraceae bacterium]|nr:ABC transporter ATP-binding protein [Desulfobacteraceae bacterium]
MMNEFVLNNIYKSMGPYGVLEHINLSMEKGERVCLLGPSGCGKTTLLRIAAGLEQPDSGDVIFRGRSLLHIPPHKRNFGMMFQDFALFPHRNVFDNIAFGLEMKKRSRREITDRVHGMLELVNLEGYGQRRVEELSGGQRQRVALARTLAPAPGLVMLDEPLGSLDRRLRERLLADLCTILTQTGATTIFVTHDQNEAFAAADRICMMNQGKVRQIDTPENLYANPSTPWVADFLGFQNIIKARRAGEGRIEAEGAVFFPEQAMDDQKDDSMEQVFLLLLPDAATPVSAGEYEGSRGNRIRGVLTDRFFQGSFQKISMEAGTHGRFVFEIPSTVTLPKPGEPLFLKIDPRGLRLLG